jgi:hypothetical protein
MSDRGHKKTLYKKAFPRVISRAPIRLVCGRSVGAGVDSVRDQEKQTPGHLPTHVTALGVSLSPPKSLPVV